MGLKYPFGIISDIHAHDWNGFAYPLTNKVNSRLQIILDAIEEACLAVDLEGGNQIVVTGDLFHTRGSVKPSVFNPVFDKFVELSGRGYSFYMYPGNHDLENKDSDTIGNILNSFRAIPNVRVFNEVTTEDNFVFIPWIDRKDDFIKVIDAIPNPTDKVVFCHIGIDGVLDSVSGKIGKSVVDKGFKYVFAGDYHNHKCLGSGIYSVGALTHNSFSDMGSVAGFLIVTENEVIQKATKAPKFVENPTSPRQMKNNYIRLTGEMDAASVQAWITECTDNGAKGVQDLTTRPTLSTSTSAVVRVDLGLDAALESYCKMRYGSNADEVLEEARRLDV